jgi:hypothetical protein
MPSFHPAPESQPVLPALLRRLLLKGAQAEALALAKRHEAGPHFARCVCRLMGLLSGPLGG